MLYSTITKILSPIPQALLCLVFISGISLSSSTIDTTGSGGLISGHYRQALDALKRDTVITDSVYWRFKQGLAFFYCHDYERAVTQLSLCVSDSSQLRGIAYCFIGDAETARNRPSDAATAYLSAKRDSLPPAIIWEIEGKLYSLVKAHPDLAAPFSDLAALAAEKQFLLAQNADTLGPKLDSLLGARLWPLADSMLTRQLNSTATKKNCSVIGLIAGYPIPDTALSTMLLFRLARAAYQCKEWTEADLLLKRTESRRDFAGVVPIKEYTYLRGFLSYSLSHYQAAASFLADYYKRFGALPEVVLTLGRVNRSLGNNSLAAFWYNRFVRLFPKHSNTPDVYWYLAWKEEEDEHFDKAAGLYQKLYRLRKYSSRADDAFFRNGLCWYKDGKYIRACSTFTALGKVFGDSPFAIAALYWKGKCLLAEGITGEASEAFAAVVRTAPVDFYAYRAREMLTLSGDTAHLPVLDTTFTIDATRAWIDSVSPPQKQSLKPDDSSAYGRGTLLAMCGLTGFASHFLEGLEMRYPSNLDLQFDLAYLYKYANDRTLSFRVARRLSWRVPPAFRSTLPAPLYEILYPQPYADLIVREGNRNAVDPYLVVSVMRQESLFDPDVQSRAGAIGLMQIMPFTGRAIARNLGDPFCADSLLNPQTNIRYGAFYLKQLLEQFKGNMVLAIASYNGGPSQAVEWYEKNKRKTFDLFIEDIGFTETRGYVKKVLANYWTYRMFAQQWPLH
jgi:tetratricopeptide (TPR) repeat protein